MKQKKKNKQLINLVFGSVFAVALSFIVWCDDLYKYFHRYYHYEAIIQDDLFFYFSYAFAAVWIIIILCYYSKFQHNGFQINWITKRAVLLPVLFGVITVLFIMVSYCNYSYIVNNSYYHKSFTQEKVLLKSDDINSATIEVINEPYSVGGKGIILEDYYIRLTINDKYTLNSHNFYDYKCLYGSIKNSKEININNNNYDELIKSEKRKLFSNRNEVNKNVKYIQRIFELNNLKAISDG